MQAVSMNELLAKASKEGYAVGNFDVFNLEMMQGVALAAERTRSPLIFAGGTAFDDILSLEVFAGMAREIINELTVPAAILIDHANDIEAIKRALDCGFTSVMVDGSDRPLKENIKITLEAKRLCEKYGASLEAELGHVGGLEGLYISDDYEEVIYTDTEEAILFVKETGVDALAVAIGTVHGAYKAAPKLNFNRLREINDAVTVPLVLHGGSGLSDEELNKCVKNGINKINIFTDLVIAATTYIDECKPGQSSYFAKSKDIIEVVAKVAQNKMEVLGSAGKA